MEAVLHTPEPPAIATFRIPIVVGQRVRYVGPGSDEPQRHESGTVVDVNQYANEVVVAWDVSSTLAHGRPEDDLEPVDS